MQPERLEPLDVGQFSKSRQNDTNHRVTSCVLGLSSESFPLKASLDRDDRVSDLAISAWMFCDVQLVLSGMECPLDFKFLFLASPYITLCSLPCFSHTSDLPTQPLQVYVKTFNAEPKLFLGGPVTSPLAPPYQCAQRPEGGGAQGSGCGSPNFLTPQARTHNRKKVYVI